MMGLYLASTKGTLSIIWIRVAYCCRRIWHFNSLPCCFGNCRWCHTDSLIKWGIGESFSIFFKRWISLNSSFWLVKSMRILKFSFFSSLMCCLNWMFVGERSKRQSSHRYTWKICVTNLLDLWTFCLGCMQLVAFMDVLFLLVIIDRIFCNILEALQHLGSLLIFWFLYSRIRGTWWGKASPWQHSRHWLSFVPYKLLT